MKRLAGGHDQGGGYEDRARSSMNKNGRPSRVARLAFRRAPRAAAQLRSWSCSQSVPSLGASDSSDETIRPEARSRK